MAKPHKLFIRVVGVITLVAFIFGIFIFINNLQKTRDDSSLPSEAVLAFQEKLIGRALARGPHPIEGFDASMLLDAFPGLKESDFEGVTTGIMRGEGVYSYMDGELQWERTTGQPITSAEKTVSKKGYGVLLENLSRRLDMPASSAKEATAIIDKIDLPTDITTHILSKRDIIKVYTPAPLSIITSPLTVFGEARGSWFFEADFQLTLVDWDGRIIADSYAAAQDDPEDGFADGAGWMTEEFVPFKGTIEFELSEENRVYNRGTLIFQKANPSGLSERADALEIPILFE